MPAPLQELQRVVLTTDLPRHDPAAGDVGTIVDVYADGRGYEVEFFTLTGQTITVATVTADQLRPIADSDGDVLLVFEPGATPELEPWLDMHDALRDIFGRDVDIVQKRLLKNPFRRHHILANRRILYAQANTSIHGQ